MPLSVSSGIGTWIDDFVNSTDPRFKGKSKEKRRQMALGAFYSAQRKKKESTLLANAQYLLELDNTPNQDKRDLSNPDNPYVQNRTVPPQSRYVSGGASNSAGVASPGMPAQATGGASQPSLDTSGPLSSTSTAIPSSMSSRTGDLMGAQGNLAPPPTDLSTSSTYKSNTPKELDDLSKSKTKPPTSDSLFMSARQLLLFEADERIGPPTKAHAIKLVKNLLTARRNGNVKLEQHHHQKLLAWSQKHNIDMDNTIKGASKELGHSVAALMGGIV